MASTVTELLRRRMMGASGGEHDYSKDYLTTTALESGCIFTLTIASGVSTSLLTSISYSIDGGANWTTTSNVDATAITIQTPTIGEGESVLWKGIGTALASGNANTATIFSTNKNYKVSGNILSMLCGDNYESETRPNTRAFNSLFRYNYYLTDASNLIISGDMGDSMYAYLFGFCTSLTEPPALPAQTLVNACYGYMFYGCTSLVNAPILPAQTLATYCYNYMFGGCTSLSYIKMLALNITATRALYNWVNGVAASGTFVKSSQATWTATGVSGIPDGWTVETE